MDSKAKTCFLPSAELVTKVLQTVDKGLSSGLGEPVPGSMCVEAAVCYAMGLPHSDKPTCVGDSVRGFKIRLNDSRWSSKYARAVGMRKLAVAQLGSDSIDQKKFAELAARGTIQKLLPAILRKLSENPRLNDFKTEICTAASTCEKHGTEASAKAAKEILKRAANAAYAAANAAEDAAYVAATAAAYAADAANAAANAAYYAADAAYYAADAANAAADAANAAAYAADAAYVAATAAANAAYAAAYAAADAADEILLISAQVGLDALIELNSPGVKFLYLT